MQLGFRFDQTRCTGCYACVVACKDWNDVPASPASWRWITFIEKGDWPDLFAAYLPSSCYHCANPVCAAVCPAEAISKREDNGVVVVDRNKCRAAVTCGIIMNKNILYGETKAPCVLACPAGVSVSGYIALISKGKFNEALELIRRDLPLPAVCGRVCKHPCETVCKRRELDDPLSIANLKRFITDSTKPDKPKPLPITQYRKVAIVGSGPAGLAAAWTLLKNGYPVTVFEALPVAGGMLATGIPEYRLPRKVLQQDLDYLLALGIEIKTNSPIKNLDDLKKQGFEAVCIAIGALRGNKPKVPGASLYGTFTGTSFLRDVNFGNNPKLGRRVVVVGGGSVALDCARSALRLGVKDVHVVSLEDKQSMPADPSEVSEGIEEGIVIHDACSITRVLGYNGKVTGIEFHSIYNLTFEHGRPNYDILSDSVQTIAADSIIFAVGQSPDLAILPKPATTQSGYIDINPVTFLTSLPSIFAVGDATGDSASVIDAIASGKRVAASVQCFLEGLVLREASPCAEVSASDIQVEIPANIRKQRRQPVSKVPIAQRTAFDEVSLGFSKEAAVTEAKRCLNCAGHLCKIVCPYSAPQFGDEPVPKMQMCNLCLDRWAEKKKPICVAACPTRALDAGPIEDFRRNVGNTKETEGFTYSEITTPSVVFKPKVYKPANSS